MTAFFVISAVGGLASRSFSGSVAKKGDDMVSSASSQEAVEEFLHEPAESLQVASF
jgi:hypothetical protein